MEVKKPVSRALSRRFFIVFIVAVLTVVCVTPAEAATPQKTVNASATLFLTVKGLQHNVVIQNFYIGSTYLYVTQRVNGTVYLSRCLMSGNEATFVNKMTLTNCGHGQTLDMYTYNGVDYFYVSSKADPSTSYYWSLQVARLKYQPGVTLNYTDLRRFTYMNYANPTGTRLGTTYRVAGGGNSNYTIFRIQTVEGSVTYSIYNTAALNQLLDANQQVRMDSAAAKAACVKSFTQTGSAIVRPNGSFQGVDMLSNNEIYVTGGGHGDVPQIARMSNTGTYQTLVKIINVGNYEIEGVQTKNSRVYFVIVPNTTSKKNTQRVYYVSDSIFD
ncbi:MAG TPA: hypothetical protein GX011_00615 [Clostridiales bacterium]|nr:hypothetical protein [Clostridiales bacterium]